jgi:hypothetical protein
MKGAERIASGPSLSMPTGRVVSRLAVRGALRDSGSLAWSSTGSEVGTAFFEGNQISWIHGLSTPRWVRTDGVIMAARATVGIAGIVLGLILLFVLPTWLVWVGIAIIVAAVAIPVAGYLALDKSQRRRLRAIRARQRGE